MGTLRERSLFTTRSDQKQDQAIKDDIGGCRLWRRRPCMLSILPRLRHTFPEKLGSGGLVCVDVAVKIKSGGAHFPDRQLQTSSQSTTTVYNPHPRIFYSILSQARSTSEV